MSQSSSQTKKSGAVLFAVVGAKLSEGLNFTDDLARAVIIIGLPFANLASAELRERMSYVNRLEQKRTGGRAKEGDAKDAGTELYENMCMNAINQSIGRVTQCLTHSTLIHSFPRQVVQSDTEETGPLSYSSTHDMPRPEFAASSLNGSARM